VDDFYEFIRTRTKELLTVAKENNGEIAVRVVGVRSISGQVRNTRRSARLEFLGVGNDAIRNRRDISDILRIIPPPRGVV